MGTYKYNVISANEIKLTSFEPSASDLKDLVIPSEYCGYVVREIGKSVFASMGLTGSVTIPSSVRRIFSRAFYDNDITSINIEEGDNLWAIDDRAFAKTKIEELNLPLNINYLGIYSFSNCKKLKRLNIPGVKTINHNAFEGCDNLKNVCLPTFCCSVSQKAFTNVEKVVINPFIETISADAFNRSVEVECDSVDIKNAIKNGIKYSSIE